jgi:hypothetical protein
VHPSILHVLKFFKHDHLLMNLQNVVRPFADLATLMANRYDGPETTECLRKLLEAKDCAVRAAL